MYVTRLQITNYGPIADLDLNFPFTGEAPVPVVLVGPNGAGKTIVLSHIMNALLAAKEVAFPETPEVAVGRAFKFRSPSYIKSGSQFSFSRADFSDGFYRSELTTGRAKETYAEPPTGILASPGEMLWDRLSQEDHDHVDTNMSPGTADPKAISKLFADNCYLYFPADRFEYPAWLNTDGLEDRARHMAISHLVGTTSRRMIATSPLQQNRDWLYDVVYDRAAFEFQTRQMPVNAPASPSPVAVPVFTGYSGEASRSYDAALKLVQTLTGIPNSRFGIGRRQYRIISLIAGESTVAPNIFQLSSGELSVLNIGLSILRDFELAGGVFSTTSSITGLVLIDEADLHLHSSHQYTVFPELIALFPRVQFVITTHSPLLLLGMRKTIGENNFAIYSLPEGRPTPVEHFEEFEQAYTSLTETQTYAMDVDRRIGESRRPVLFPEGDTDKQYIETAARFLERTDALSRFDVWEGGGKGSLRKLWGSFTGSVAKALPQPIVLLFDCDTATEPDRKGRLVRRTIPFNEENPIGVGVENLFTKATLERARTAKPAFIDVEEAHTVSRRGQEEKVPETWTVNADEKANLCHWLCENGDAGDFEGFDAVFDLLEDALPELDEGT